MNERIKELLLKSREECFHIGSKSATTIGYDELEKFAELIIEECVTKMALEIMDKQWVDDAVKNTYDYFGIKSE